MGGAVSNAFSGITEGVRNVGNAASGAVNNVTQGVQQFGQGAQQLGSGDLRGLQTMGGSLVNTGSGLFGNTMDSYRGVGQGLFGGFQGTPLYGMTQGNLAGLTGGLEGVVRGNIAGIQDLPTDIGAGVQQGLDQIGGAAQDLLSGLGNALGGGDGGGAGGGVSAPQYYKDLAKKQAEYGMNLPDEFQRYEGERFAAPSDRTQAAETAIYNNNANSQQAAFNRAGELMNQGNQYRSTSPTAANYGNINAGLSPAQDYSRNFQQNMAQFQNPYTSQVVNQTIKDMDRARQMTANQISGDAARAGAFGGSREALMRAENNRNFADRTAAAVGQLRQQGFNTAVQMAQDEQMKRLGLSASERQNVRGYQSQGNLAGQSLTAQSQENLQRNRLTDAANQAQYGQAANNAALTAAQLQGQLGGQMDDRTRQQLYDRLQMGQNQDARNQAQADFNYQQFVDETQNFPQQYLANLNNAGSLGSRLIYTQQPTSGGQKGGLAGILGGALSGAAAGGPMGALIGGGLGALGAGVPSNMAGLDKFTGLFDSPAEQPMLYNPNQMNQMGY